MKSIKLFGTKRYLFSSLFSFLSSLEKPFSEKRRTKSEERKVHQTKNLPKIGRLFVWWRRGELNYSPDVFYVI
jgi:hypothetical protein